MPDHPIPVDDSLPGREPTSHERMAAQPWDASYRNGPAPWDIGHPQPAISRLAAQNAVTGRVLDIGCGTGEHALLFASLGCTVLGVDVADTALRMAREKAAKSGANAEFLAADALHLDRLNRTFDTALDCGLFHTLDDDERLRYLTSLASVLKQNGTLFLLCFSDARPDTGPHPVTEQQVRAAFDPGNGWTITDLQPDSIQTRLHANGAPAWLVTVKRI